MESESCESLVAQGSGSGLADDYQNHIHKSTKAITHSSETSSSINTLPQDKATKSSMATIWMFWKWEIMVSFLVLAMTFIIFATLYPHNGRPLPQWRFRISINALLSIYSIILKAGVSFITVSCIGQLQWSWFSQRRPLYDLVRYDNAGRGAWGLLQLLWVQRLSQPLAALGAILLVLSIGIDPSIQQLVSSLDCSVPVNHREATLPRTNTVRDLFGENPPFEDAVGSVMLRAISGLGNDIYSDCTTGNCSFSDQYGTLGYCSACKDSSHEITVDTYNTTSHIPDTCIGTVVTSTVRSSLPKIQYPDNNKDMSTQLNVTYNTTYCVSDGVSHRVPADVVELAQMRVSYDNYREPRLSRITVQILAGKPIFSDDRFDKSTDLPDIPHCQPNSQRCGEYQPVAANCILHPCVRIYNASVKAGHLTEQLLDHTGGVLWGPHTLQIEGLGMIDTHCLSPQDEEGLTKRGYVANTTSRWLPSDVAMTDAGGDPLTTEMTNHLLRKKCLYIASYNLMETMQLVGTFFNGTLTLTKLTKLGDSKGLVFLSSLQGPQLLKQLYDLGQVNFSQIQGVFTNISDSLTSYIRTHGDVNYSEPAVGQAFHYATCLRVQWQWISFPSLIALLTIALFMATTLSKSPSRFPAWKTSFLPWMILGPGGVELLNSDELEEHSLDVRDIENKSKGVTVTWKSTPHPHIQL